MNFRKFLSGLVLLLGVVGLSAAQEQTESNSLDINSETPLPLEELRTFTEAFVRIKAAYVEEVSDEDLIESAIGGMLAGLDPHSVYLDPDGYDELQTGTSGKFGGLGIEIVGEELLRNVTKDHVSCIIAVFITGCALQCDNDFAAIGKSAGFHADRVPLIHIGGCVSLLIGKDNFCPASRQWSGI